jgi:hypothetical protein
LKKKFKKVDFEKSRKIDLPNWVFAPAKKRALAPEAQKISAPINGENSPKKKLLEQKTRDFYLNN